MHLLECEHFLFSDSVLKIGKKGEAHKWVGKYEEALKWLPKDSDLHLKDHPRAILQMSLGC